VAQSTHPDKRRSKTRNKTRIISVANQKGGVGKTTTAVNLGTALAAVGRQVLIIDLDPQANATTGLGLIHGEAELTSYDVVIDDVTVEEATVRTLVPGLWMVPTSVHLSAAEIELVGLDDREYVLRDKLVGQAGDYDYVLIDCPPALGLLTINALVASDAVLVPLQCEYYALEGMSHLVRTIERVRGNLNPRLELQGVVLTMFDRRNNLCDMVAEDVRDVFGEKVYRTVIPRNVRVSEAPSHGKPVLLYDLSCAGSQAYAHLASEVLKRERALREGRIAA
jgi:chromosome partitioning protein